MDVSRSMGSPGKSRGRRLLLSDLGNQHQIRNRNLRNKKECFQGFLRPLGQLRALKPSLPIPPVAGLPRVVAELLRFASLLCPREARPLFQVFL